MSDIKDMIGKIATNVEATSDDGFEPDRLVFTFSDGSVGKFHHWQDCCERVFIEAITGDLADLTGAPILVADERTSDDHDGIRPEDLTRCDDSNTWTFYTFRTIKGSVDVRWHGTSNGYYSEDVDFDISNHVQ